MSTRTYTHDALKHSGETISVSGWVHSRRDHGGLIFIDVRDHTGILQLVINPETPEAFSLAEQLRDEFVIRADGLVREREAGLKNDKIPTGSIELAVQHLTIFNRAEALPIQPFADAQANEDLRFKYRYLDLRRSKIQDMLRKRAEMYARIHAYMDSRDFIEIQTPILANSSPEGARDFLIPSRLQEGKFYALPQAPQQFKQLLMVGGVPRYYQLAACFRDEDPRADRLYGEFYQLDCEMSFVEDGEEVREMMEPLMKELAIDFAGKHLLSEDIPRIPYQIAMDTYGSDKPDLRYDMTLVDVSAIYKDTEFGVFRSTLDAGGVIKAIRVERGAELSRKQIDSFTDIAKSEGAGGLPYVMKKDGELVAPIVKFMSHQELTELASRMNIGEGDAVFFGVGERALANAVLGKLRGAFADHFGLKDPDLVAFAWIVDFPFYEWDAKAKKIDFGHNPFSMPKGGLEAVRSTENKLDIVADQYDMVMNGYEICSGGVRNHNPDVLYEVFDVLGYDKAYVEEKFGAMINAFKFGAPPHAGCAFGVDRILMELMNETNVREVVAFPKNGSGVDVMMNSPSSVDAAQLKELGL